MPMLENVIRLFAPHICLGCGVEEDLLLCLGCREAIIPVPPRCYVCAGIAEDYEVCRACKPHTPLSRVIVCAEYEGLSKKLVRQVKYERARAGAREMADLLLQNDTLRATVENAVMVPAPTATSRVRARGYDQAVLLSKEISRGLPCPWGMPLVRVGQARQVGTNRATRKRQLEGVFRVARPDLVAGRPFVLVDDVLTTGATLEAAASALLAAGATRVDAVVFAQA